MDYQIIIFLTKKGMKIVDVTDEDSYDFILVEDLSNLEEAICQYYSADCLDELAAEITIINCGATKVNCKALQEKLAAVDLIDVIDIRRVLPMVAERENLWGNNKKLFFEIEGNFFVVKRDTQGNTKAYKTREKSTAISLTGQELRFWYFYKNTASNYDEEEYYKLKEEIRHVQRDAEIMVVAAEEEAKAEIALAEEKYLRLQEQYERCQQELAALKSKENNKFADLRCGDVIKFGQYYQKTADTKQDIEWVVMEIEDDSAVLLSKYGLDAVPFNQDPSTNKWELCSLRKWLNQKFLREAFTAKEQERLLSSSVQPGLKDKVRLMSLEEAKKCLSSNNKLMPCQATSFAKMRGAYVEKKTSAGYWWLGAEGCFDNCVLSVNEDGSLHTEGYYPNYKNQLVRPVIWLKLF